MFEGFDHQTGSLTFSGVSGSLRAYLIGACFKDEPRPMVVVTRDQKSARQLLTDLEFYLTPAPQLHLFPAYHLAPYKTIGYHNETAAHRIRTLYRLTSGQEPSIVVTTAGALMQRIVPKRELVGFSELILAGEDLDRDGLIEKLFSGGYTRTLIVEEPGDISVRGGIIDVFSPLYDDPLRIEMFGDQVESVRFFSASSQRTLSRVDEAVLVPAGETIIAKEHLEKTLSRIRLAAAEMELPVTAVREIVDRIKNEGFFPGIETLLPLVYGALDTLLDYTSPLTRFVLDDPVSLENEAAATWDHLRERYSAVKKETRLAVAPERLYAGWDEMLSIMKSRDGILNFRPLGGAETLAEEGSRWVPLKVADNSDIRFKMEKLAGNEAVLSPFVEWLREQREAGRTTVIASRSRERARALDELLKPYDIRIHGADRFPEPGKKSIGMVYGRIGSLGGGFVWPEKSLAVITDSEIFGRQTSRPAHAARRPHTELLTFEDLKAGDLVVHTEHGIGRYEGLVKLTLNGTQGDFLQILYRDADRLYLPVDRMNAIQKYLGVDDAVPVLDKMGGKSWERVKARVKRSAEKIAGELLKLYATREAQEGTAMPPVEDLQAEFLEDFGYEETPDQLRAIDDVLSDMAKPKPMDRLICGDVGYGKTEVALRAAHTAVQNGKQVALLVPTTVLAEQHFATFSNRFKRTPFNVACLNRFRSSKSQREIIEKTRTGQVDVVIGTHRLLSKDVAFRDLGLLILDEEQRFGVKHKEKLKNLRATVDVLTLTATPIPRTLHLSLMGIRDISVISTPPEFRRAIITYITEFDERVVQDAIKKELARCGQIYFVHNNVRTIESVAAKLKTLAPEVRLDIAHGQMDEKNLEKAMLRFFEHEIDMLVCTTIIESGLDVPNANTLLVNRADRFGLSQMYQLRGRVGRSEEQAYAYLFIPPEAVLSQDAKKRLKVLMEHSDLGAGFQIAMSDLKIRGGGTILGANQSGHIAAVGYDMFLQLMEEAVAELKGEVVREPLDPEINLQLSAHLPDTYIPDIDQRLSTYRRLARLKDPRELTAFKQELIDRFGRLPEEGNHLLLKFLLRILAIQAGVKRVDITDQEGVFHFSEAHQQKPGGIVEMILKDPEHYQLTPDHLLKVRWPLQSMNRRIMGVKNILKEIIQHVNCP